MSEARREEARPIQFRLRTLLLFVGVGAAILSATGTLGIDYRLAVFAIGFLLFIGLVMVLIGGPRKPWVPVHMTNDPMEGVMCLNYLRLGGVKAEIKDRSLIGFGRLAGRPVEVLVPEDQLEKAVALLAERAKFEPTEEEA